MQITINGANYGDFVTTKNVYYTRPDDERRRCSELLHEYAEYEEMDGEQSAASVTASALPEALLTPQAEALLGKLVSAGLLSADWQPLGLSNTQKALLASELSLRLDIATPWKTWGEVWGIKPECLRTYYNRALDQRAGGDYLKKIKHCLSDD